MSDAPFLGPRVNEHHGLAMSACNKRDVLAIVPCWQDALDFGDPRTVN